MAQDVFIGFSFSGHPLCAALAQAHAVSESQSVLEGNPVPFFFHGKNCAFYFSACRVKAQAKIFAAKRIGRSIFSDELYANSSAFIPKLGDFEVGNLLKFLKSWIPLY